MGWVGLGHRKWTHGQLCDTIPYWMVREHSKADIIYFSGPETKEHEKKATKNEKSIISDTYRYIYAIYRYIYIFVRINCSFKNKKLKKQRKKKDTQRVKNTTCQMLVRARPYHWSGLQIERKEYPLDRVMWHVLEFHTMKYLRNDFKFCIGAVYTSWDRPTSSSLYATGLRVEMVSRTCQNKL